ncbi:MAG: acyl-CoA dehydrogenase family protein [Thermoleophilia bacterium]|nr:acyl-CoA dehydrogenase family protein [Thermoleophilia bacterium]
MSSADSTIKPDFGSKTRHFIFTEEHEQLRETIEKFCDKELAPHAEEWEKTTFPDSVFTRMGELGFLGLTMPEEYGGQGGDYFTSVVRAEAMSHSLSGGLNMGLAVQTDMTMPPILKFGSEEIKQRYLVPAIKGEKILCLGITEPDAGSDVAAIKTRAVRDGDDYVINGSKVFITNGIRADAIVLVTKTDDSTGYEGFSLFVVDTDTPGFSVSRKLEKLGMHASDTAELAFTDMRVPAANMLGEEGKGFYNIMWELQGERLVAACGAVAGAQRCMEKTMDYARERQAFGRPIGKFQSIRHKFAAMSSKIEAARQFNYYVAWLVDRGDYPVREISQAKLFATQVACEAVDECLQIHGGWGYMKEYGIERVWRDMRLNRIGAGTDEVMLDVIGRSYGF